MSFFTGSQQRNQRGLWVTWESQRRNAGISTALEFEFACFEHDTLYPPIRYVVSILQTLWAFLRYRPAVVVAQNPSIVLACTSVLASRMFKFRCFIDAHNAGIRPSEGNSKVLMKIARWLQKSAEGTIVTNHELAHVVEKNGGNAFVLPDRVPVPPLETGPKQLGGETNIVSIGTYSPDEPFLEIIKASEILVEEGFHFYLTGDNRKCRNIPISRNVTQTGYLPELEYWGLLMGADIIVDLTYRSDCLVCGAYEAIALGKPLVLSDTQVNKSYFSTAAMYSSNNAESIAEALRDARSSLPLLRPQMEEARAKLTEKWKTQLNHLKHAMGLSAFHGITQ